MFIEDKADGQVEFEDKDGNIFQSEASSQQVIDDNKKRNSREQLHSNDSVQAGAFLNGRLYWLSVVNYKNGDKYKGFWCFQRW